MKTNRAQCSQSGAFVGGRAVAAAVAVLPALFLAAPAAQASFSLGTFDYYGLLVNDGDANGDINTAPVEANIGIGALQSGKTVNLHNEVVNGQVDCEVLCSSSVSNGAITGTQPASRGGPAPAALHSNVAQVSAAILAASNLSSFFGGESGTAITINNTTQTINASSGTLDGTGNRIFTAPSFSIGNSHTVTINGTASDYVVINVTGNSNDKLDGALTLTGGITPDQVIINFIGVGNAVQGAANGATLQGTFLIPNMKVQLNSLTINGRVFGGQPGVDFAFVSNALIQQPAVIPVPAASLLFGSGLSLLVAVRRRRAA
jgi:choice-of-anchor A domain-containing protein